MSAAAGELALPRWARRWGIPLGCVLLTGLFFVAGLPADRIGTYATARLRAATGADIRVRELGLGVGLPVALSARGVIVRFAGADPIELERARVRPAWSFSWLRGRPALAIDLASPLGSADGTVTLGGEPGFDGEIENVDLAKLPLATWLPGASAEGRLRAEGDVRRTAAGPRGELALDVREGSVSLPTLPVALPFTSLQGSVRFTDEAALELDHVTLEGPMLAGSLSGTVGHAAIASEAPLALELRIEAREESLRPLLAGQGLRVGPDGSAHVSVSGTVSAPSLR